MKKSKLRQTVIGGLLVLSQAGFAHAEEKRIVLPSETRRILSEFESSADREKLVRFLSPEVTAQIEAYANMDDEEVLSWDPRAATPAAYAGAVAGGAAAAVVERLWDKYVGNGKPDMQDLRETEFDFLPAELETKTHEFVSIKIGPLLVLTGGDIGGLERPQTNFSVPTLLPHDVLEASVTEIIRQQQEVASFAARPETAQFGLAVGTAAAAMVGYKAAEWAMNRTGTAHPTHFEVPETHFDIR